MFDLRHVDRIARDARAARGLVAFFRDHVFETVERVAGAADVRDHAGAISWISAMACFMRMSLIAPLRLSILARAVCTATSRAFTRFL